MADQYVTTAQGLGITSWSDNKQEAADFLMYMHTPDRLKAWFEYTGVIPADDRLDPSIITQPQLQQAYEWDTTKAGPNMENFIPSMLDEQAAFAGAQLLFAGDMTPEELAQMTEDVAAKWREQNPDAVENFKIWGASEVSEEPEAEAPAEAAEPVELVMWWWGEQEAPGAQEWLDETVELYQTENPNVSIETVLQSTDSLIPAFQSAMAAEEGPDIQYFWGGVWTLEFAWGGGVAPIDDLIPEEELAHYINNFERTYDGQIWGVPWYMSGNPFVYNKSLFEQAGLDPEKPIETWDELLEACEKLNAIGVTPISGGLKDGWFGGWLYSILSRQTHDSEKEYMKASVGEASFTDPEFAEYWVRLNELKEAGCWNEDINSLDYQQGMDEFVQGEAAMIFGNDTFLAGWAESMGGWDDIGLMLVPKYGDGAMADQYVTTAQGLGITSWSDNKQEAADFLMYMHTPDRRPTSGTPPRLAPTWRTSSPPCWMSRPPSPEHSSSSRAI
jgi:multiple sugar transport system substrate-binding protein